MSGDAPEELDDPLPDFTTVQRRKSQGLDPYDSSVSPRSLSRSERETEPKWGANAEVMCCCSRST